MPAFKWTGMIRHFSDILEPDAALFFNLPEIRAAISRKNKRNLMFPPRIAGHLASFGCDVVPTIASGLGNVTRNIFYVSFGFGNAERLQPCEQNVIGRPTCGRPLRNRLIDTASRASTKREAECLG